MADGDTKDYAGQKKKPSMALIISVGPKMPKSPEDTSKPDDKAMKKAWDFLKADEPQDYMNRPPMQQAQTPQGYIPPQQPQNPPLPSPYDMRNPPAEPPLTDFPIPSEDANPYQPSDEVTRRKIMQMLPPIPPREQRRNMMRDGTPHTPGQQSMIDRATEMYRQQKMRGE